MSAVLDLLCPYNFPYVYIYLKVQDRFEFSYFVLDFLTK